MYIYLRPRKESSKALKMFNTSIPSLKFLVFLLSLFTFYIHSLWHSFILFVLLIHNSNLDIIMGALEQHLSLEINQSTLLGRFEGPYQGFVIVLDLVIVKQITKQDKGLSWFPAPPYIRQELLALFVQSGLMKRERICE